MAARIRRLVHANSIFGKMLVVILPLIIIPMLILGAVGFVTANREAAQTSTRYLAQRENDLRTIAENPAIRDYFNNRFYRLEEEAEVFRGEIERSLRRLAERSNSIELTYRQLRYVDDQGQEIAKIVDGRIADRLGGVTTDAFFENGRNLGPGEVYLSPTAAEMVYAMPVYEPAPGGGTPTFQGMVVLDFVYPIEEFRRTVVVIARTFLVITGLSLGVAVFLIVGRVGSLTRPIRRLADAANRIAAGERSIAVEIGSKDELGNLATSFNQMAESLSENETALKRKLDESTALYDIAREITAQVALDPTLELIVERARSLLKADTSLLALRQGHTEVFATQAGSGDRAETFAEFRFRPGEGVGGRVVAGGKPILAHDYLEEYGDSPFLHMVQEAEVRSLVAVPLKSREETIGVLYVSSRAPHRFREDDVRLLAALAAQATTSIENARLYHQVRQHAAELENKVEERTHELQEANLKLEAASRHKSEFLANMSHELRTPMNAIIGFTRLVMRRSKDQLPARQYENLQKILVSADHLLTLINDVLDLSKVEAGRLEVHPEEFALTPLVEECLRTVEPMLRGDGARLAKNIEEGLPVLHTDQDKLKQILINLLSNAAKFSERGTITTTARRLGDDIAISVADQGIGIPEGARESVFEEFRQADSGTTRQYGGTGLGLSISRHLARLMGGDITLESEVGRGSTFTVTIPLRYAAGGAPKDASANELTVGQAER